MYRDIQSIVKSLIMSCQPAHWACRTSTSPSREFGERTKVGRMPLHGACATGRLYRCVGVGLSGRGDGVDRCLGGVGPRLARGSPLTEKCLGQLEELGHRKCERGEEQRGESNTGGEGRGELQGSLGGASVDSDRPGKPVDDPVLAHATSRIKGQVAQAPALLRRRRRCYTPPATVA